jgi:glycerol-3-phosphate acyltransferase PlsY
MGLILILASYLFGSLAPARIIGKVYNVDLTHDGTTNPGATNVYKLVGPGWGIFTAFADLFKGIIPTFLANNIFNFGPVVLSLVGIGVVAGHNWPIYYNFRGGRGLATSLGTLAAHDFFLIFFPFVLAVALAALTIKIFNKEIRIPFFLYPLYIMANLIFKRNEYLFTYTVLLIIVVLIRAWHLKNRPLS